MIKIEHLSKTYPGENQVHALHDVNLHVEKGDIFGVIGMSGAGKSTLLRCISLLEQPSGGGIYIEGRNIQSLTEREAISLRREIGVIFQGYNLLMQRTVYRNIAFPLELAGTDKATIDARVKELLELVGLSDKAQVYPAQLSGGQKQRVAIARALANQSKILLCDEPTSALDSLTTRSILNLLKDINQKLAVTIVIITHEISVVKAICNKVAVIDNGLLSEQGYTSEVLEHPQSDITKLLLGIEGGDAE